MENKNKKMKMEIYDNKKIIFETENIENIMQNLLFYLYSKAVNNSKYYTIKYKYNCSDYQTIKVIDKIYKLNKREIIFYNIPTSWGGIKTFDIMQELKKEVLKNEL